MTELNYKELFSPWVMRAAWQKVQSWYMQGEWYDPAEMLAWKAETWRKLSKLATELSAGTYRPDPHPLIPYPKKGNKTRHYSQVSVKDQVAFATFLVLLGPFLEAQMRNISFGNRLARQKIQRWERENPDEEFKKRWYRLPFSLSYNRVYEPFSSGYGLFRRLLQWITNTAFFEEQCIELESIKDEIDKNSDYLPYVDHKWESDNDKLYYIRLDLSLAYPSVNRKVLRHDIRELLKNVQVSDDIEAKKEMFGPHPWHILKNNEEMRLSLADQLMDLLEHVTYCPWEEPKGKETDIYNGNAFFTKQFAEHLDYADTWGLWRPGDPIDPNTIRTGKFGLPTGNIISGLLMNVALTELDNELLRLYDESESNEEKVVSLRFVDDLILLSQDWNALGKAVATVRRVTKQSHGFTINSDKIKPEITVVQKVIADHCCKGEDFNEDNFLARWEEIESLLSKEDYIHRGNIDLFTTEIVREMSDLNQEDIDERYGSAALERVDSLLGLLARKDSDEEVAEDARANFAINKLARTAWPTEKVKRDGLVLSPQNIISQILFGAEQALRNHPWRIKLWRSVIAIVTRVAIFPGLERAAKQRFRDHILPLLNWNGKIIDHESEELSSPAKIWERANNEDCPFDLEQVRRIAKRRQENKNLRESFHRAQFWRHWASSIRGLKAVANGGYSPFWSHHFTKEDAKKMLSCSWFGRMEELLVNIYKNPQGNKSDENPHLWWWELEALLDATMATLSDDEVLEVAQKLGAPQQGQLRAQHSPLLKHLKREIGGNSKLNAFVQALDNVMGYQGQEEITFEKEGDEKAFLWFSLAPASEGEKDIFSKSLPSTRLASDWAALVRVGLWNRPRFLLREVPTFYGEGEEGSNLWQSLIALDDYACVRKLVLAHGKVLRWENCRDIFPWELDHGESTEGKSLLQFIYDLGLEKVVLTCSPDGMPPDGFVPAFGLPWQLGWQVVKAIEGNNPMGIVSPDTLVFDKEILSELAEARKMLIPKDGGRYHDQNQVTKDALAQMEKLFDTEADKPQRTKFEGFCALEKGRAPHPLFLFPYLVSDDLKLAFNFNRALLLLWLTSGSEYILNRLYEVVPWQPSLAERDYLRTSLLLPYTIWEFIDDGLSGEDKDNVDLKVGGNLGKTSIVFDEAWPEKIWDIDYSEQRSLIDFYGKHLNVRIVQVMNQLDYSKWLQGCREKANREISTNYTLDMHRLLSNEVGEKLHEIKTYAMQRIGDADQIAIFPEWSFPPNQLQDLRRFVEKTGVAILMGLLPRELPRAVPVTYEVGRRGTRLLANEAVLIIPEPELADTCGKRRSFIFKIRKPFASIAELGLILYLNCRSEDTHWAFSPGQAWYTFTYPRWGSFSVAICSDILDTYIWDWLRGRIQHLFVVAHNKDTDLFDQLSWARSYELFANIAIANHGCYGGSLVWTPKRSFHKRIFSTHGSKVSTSFAVKLPVESLVSAQCGGLSAAIEAEEGEWCKRVGIEIEEKECKKSEFKSPPQCFFSMEAAATKEDDDKPITER